MTDEVIIVNKEDFDKKVLSMSRAGSGSLQIISDFDKTLTKSVNIKGDKVPSIISWLRRGKYLNDNYSDKAEALFSKYHPYELSTDISDKEKSSMMHEWWETHFRLLADCGLDTFTIRKATQEMVDKGELLLRDGAEEFFVRLWKAKVPLVIISASIGDIIKEYLKIKSFHFDNVHIIANMLKYDNNGKFLGVIEPIIHSMNKKEIEIKNHSEYKNLSGKNNIILLGDGLGDLGMSEGLHYDNIIRVAFYNDGESDSLDLYKKSFDVIIKGEASLEYVNDLIEKIENN
ncbi:MAG: haloacid dehalogenase-like hydrolase [Nanoarchaeota archaeon]